MVWNWKAYDKIASSNHIKSIMSFQPLHVYTILFLLHHSVRIEVCVKLFFCCNKSLLPPVFFLLFVRSFLQWFIHFFFWFPVQVMVVNDLRFLVGLAAVWQFHLLFSQVSGISRKMHINLSFCRLTREWI